MLFGRGVLRCLLKCLWGKKPSIHLTRRVPRQPLNGTKNAGDSNNLRRKMKHLELDLQKAASMLKMLRAERRVQTQCLVKAARAPACVEKWERMKFGLASRFPTIQKLLLLAPAPGNAVRRRSQVTRWQLCCSLGRSSADKAPQAHSDEERTLATSGLRVSAQGPWELLPRHSRRQHGPVL